MSHRRFHSSLPLNLTILAAGLAVLVGLLLLGPETAVAEPNTAISLSIGSYTQDFNTLAATGSGTVVPNGWAFSESGSNANTMYSVGTGSNNTGNTYSFGASGSTERAFGGLQSGNLIPTIGVEFHNDTGITIVNLAVNYTCEQWRLGAVGRVDRMDFQYSTNATSLTTGTWIDVNGLDCLGAVTSGLVGAKDGNNSAYRTAVSGNVSDLNVVNGSTFWLRWSDFNADSSDDGLAIDDITIFPTIAADGDLGEWSETNHKLGGNLGVDYYLTWDDTFLYVGLGGGNAVNGNDKYNVAVDIDPDDKDSANSGTTSEFNSVTFGADGKPDYVVQLDNDNAVYKKTGASDWVDDWVSADTTAVDNNANPGQVEFRLKWADMGLTDRSSPVGVYVWQSNSSNLSWSSFPPTNLGWTGDIHPLTTRIYLPTTDNGRVPRTYAQHLGDQTQFDANGSFSLLNGFAQVNITNGGGAGCNFKVSVKGNAPADANNSAVRRQYVIEPIGCTPTADITLTYMDGNYAAPDERNGYTDTGDLKLFRWNGSQWINAGGTTDDLNNTVSVTGVTAFSPWTFDTDTGPTAVSLQSFAAHNQAIGPVLLLALLALLIGGTAVFKRQTSNK